MNGGGSSWSGLTPDRFLKVGGGWCMISVVVQEEEPRFLGIYWIMTCSRPSMTCYRIPIYILEPQTGLLTRV